MFLLSLVMLAQATPVVPAQAAPAEDKIICRMIQEAYSRIPIRVCRKESEWALMERENQDSMRSSRHQRATGASTN